MPVDKNIESFDVYKMKPKKDRVTTGDDRKTDTMSRVDFPEPEKPKPSTVSKVGTALKKSPVTPLIAYDIGKGILSKIKLLNMIYIIILKFWVILVMKN